MLLSITLNVRFLFFFICNTSNAEQQRWTTRSSLSENTIFKRVNENEFTRNAQSTSRSGGWVINNDIAQKKKSKMPTNGNLRTHTPPPHIRGDDDKWKQIVRENKKIDDRETSKGTNQIYSLMMKRRRKWSDCRCSSDIFLVIHLCWCAWL